MTVTQCDRCGETGDPKAATVITITRQLAADQQKELCPRCAIAIERLLNETPARPAE